MLELDHLAVATSTWRRARGSRGRLWAWPCNPAGNMRILAPITGFWGWRTGLYLEVIAIDMGAPAPNHALVRSGPLRGTAAPEQLDLPDR